MKKELDRREFVKIGGLVTAGTAVGFGLPLLPLYRASATGEVADLSGTRWGMVIDVTKCPDGCTACVDACRKENNVALHGDPKTDIHWIRKAKISRRVENASEFSVPLLCNHCDNPPCALVCPVDGCIAMVERDSGLPSMTWKQYQAKLAAGEVAPIRPRKEH